tara:strand:+ start:15179 stop:16072 length:894 start_codon:yes stop_codon:yes gene_type:complete
MPNITLPTEVERAAVDTSAFTWSDSDPGSLTKAHGALLKLICDQLDAGEYVQVVSPGRGTGKTPKFIVQNCTNGADLKVILRDAFNDTSSQPNNHRANVKTVLGSIDNVYLQEMHGVVNWAGVGNTEITIKNNVTDAVIDTKDDGTTLTTPFVNMSDEDIATEVAKNLYDFHTKNDVLNKDDAKLEDGSSDSIPSDVIVFCPSPAFSGSYTGASGDEETRIDAVLRKDMSMQLHRFFNKIPVGGVLIYDKIHLNAVNLAVSDALSKIDTSKWDSVIYNNTESDNTGAYQSMAIKKLA